VAGATSSWWSTISLIARTCGLGRAKLCIATVCLFSFPISPFFFFFAVIVSFHGRRVDGTPGGSCEVRARLVDAHERGDVRGAQQRQQAVLRDEAERVGAPQAQQDGQRQVEAASQLVQVRGRLQQRVAVAARAADPAHPRGPPAGHGRRAPDCGRRRLQQRRPARPAGRGRHPKKKEKEKKNNRKEKKASSWGRGARAAARQPR